MSHRSWIVLAWTALSLSCGHSAGIAVRPRVHRVWPEPPEDARVRWVAEFPDPDAPAHRTRSTWARVVDAAIGRDAPVEPVAPALTRPFGLAAVDGGFVVADPGGRQVIRVAWPRGTARAVACAQRPWTTPMAVAAGPDGSLYVADGAAGAIIRVEPSGDCRAIGAGELARPTGVAFLAGRIYVVDPPRHRVLAFTPAGKPVLRFGFRGDAQTHGLNFPTALASTSDGELLVVDSLNARICRFAADGHYLGSFGEPGAGGGGLGRPKAVAVGGDGRVYVSDSATDHVVLFAGSGRFDLEIGGSGGGPGDLTLPAGVAVRGDYVFVADSYNHRVEVYELLENAL